MTKLLPSDPPFADYRVYGPYDHDDHGHVRRIVFLVGKSGRTSMAYARYLVCVREGRWLARGEEVDHIDDDRLNDDPSNLQVLSSPENNRKSRKPRTMVDLTCPNCDSPFTRERRQTHLIKGGSPTCCSRSCAVTQQQARRRSSSG